MKRRKIRRKMSEKRLLKLKRQLRRRAKKLRLGKKRTGAYVYGTLRRVRGNPSYFQKQLARLVAEGKARPVSLSKFVPKRPTMVKVLGYHVVEGSRRHKMLLEQKRHFDDLARGETGLGTNPRLGTHEKRALAFARKYRGWQGYAPGHTSKIVRSLARKGLVELSDVSRQFRAI